MLKSKLNRKADVSPAFQYIFALIVGAMILIFFIRFAFQAEKTGKEVIKAEVLQMLDASLQAFSVSTSSTDVLPKPPWPQMVDMEFGTKANCGKFTVVGQKFLVPIPRIVFGPEEMKAKQLNAWSNSWHFPFRVTNLFYLVNDRSKYYLMYDANNQEFVRKISSYAPETAASEMDSLPKSFDVKYSDSETDPVNKRKTSDMVKVNYFIPKNGVSEGLKGSSLKISADCEKEEEPSHNCFGTISFYQGSKQTGSSTFIGREMMFAAIMSDNIEVYDCQYGRALDELKRMTNLYISKAERLKTKRQDCEDKYNGMINLLRTMKQNIDSIRTNPSDESLAAALSSNADSIDDFNENELGGYEYCEVLF